MAKTFLMGVSSGIRAAEELKGLVDGTITEFKMPVGVNKIRKYRFFEFSELTTINLTNAIEIEDSAFEKCISLENVVIPFSLEKMGTAVFKGCPSIASITLENGAKVIGTDAFRDSNNVTSLLLGNVEEVGDYAFHEKRNVENVIIPSTIKKIGNYGFQYLAANKQSFEINFTNYCDIGNYGFHGSKVSKLKGKLGNIGNYAFQGIPLATFEEVDIEINGDIGTYAFDGYTSLSQININPNSNIKALNDYAFRNLGSNRTEPENNIITYDLRKSSFPDVKPFVFGGSGTTEANRTKYFNVFLPKTVVNISAQAFRYAKNFNLYLEGVPTLANVNAFQDCIDYKILIDYNLYSEIVSATNWISIADKVLGYIDGSKIGLGNTLPTHSNVSGKAMTWYSDDALTNVVTTVSDEAAIYYAIETGETREKWYLDMSKLTRTNVSLKDENNNTYTDSTLLDLGITLTVESIVPEEGLNLQVFKVNGLTANVGDSFVVDQNIEVFAFSFDGELNFDFETALPIEIKIASDSGAANLYTLGATRNITLTNGQVITLRIADNEQNKILKEDDSYAGLVIEASQIIRNNRMNASNNNAGGWNASEMRSVQMEDIYNLLPNEWKDVISPVKIIGSNGTSSVLNTSIDKLWLPSEREIFATRSYSVASEFNALQQFALYRDILINPADRVKRLNGNTGWWWLRSPHASYSSSFVIVNNDGGVSYNNASNSNGVAPCFAI